MTTKECHNLPIKGIQNPVIRDPSNSKYSNFNLNQINRNSSNAFFGSIKNAKIEERKVLNTDDFVKNNDLQKSSHSSSNKSTKELSRTFVNNAFEKEYTFKKRSATKSAKNSSTLSLQIAAYENSTNLFDTEKEGLRQNGLIKNHENAKEFFMSSVIQNPFEFQRQQNKEFSQPEVSQFKASQKLRNPNQINQNRLRMNSSLARRFNDTPSTMTTTTKDFATQKWNANVDTLWPWKEEILNEYREKVDASKFYPTSGPKQSPYGSNGATRLIVQMHSVFNKISEMAAENKITIEDAMTYAEMYRKAIRKTTEEICQQAHASEEAFYADSLIVASTVWGLVESILIRPSNRSIVADLIEWANDTFGQANELLNEVEKQAANAPRVEEKDFYWTSVVSLILVGQFQSASKVLSLASDARHNMKLQRMISLLQLFDYNDLHADSSGSKFIYAKKQVQKYKEVFADDEPLIFIANMLLGDISTFKKASESLSRQWFELLPAYILFSNPIATVDDLNDLTMELYNAIGINAQKSHNFLNKFIMSLMKMDWIEALHDLASVASLLWLSVHLFDLILKIDDSRLTEEIETIRDTVFITYAKEIFRTTTNSKLIPCAVTYAFATKEYKYDFVEPFLCLIAANDGPRNPDLIETLMKICQEYGFFQAFHEITLALSCIALRGKDWSKALYWALQNESLDVLETVAHFVLLNASPSTIKNLNILQEENEVINQSDAMKFLLHFHQFNVALESRDIPKATGLLHDLIISNLAPPEFMQVLFDNIADVIDATNRCLDKEPLLNPEAITKLQRCLTLFQTQEEIRTQGSARRFDIYDKVDKKLTYLHSVLINALALTALKK